jgi:GINS complex subunit 3
MSQQHSGNYYDIDDILSEETRVPTQFLVNASQLGHFVPGNEVQRVQNLPKGTKLELPLWLSKILEEKSMVQVQIPSCYGPRSRSRLRADAWSINIRDKCPYFYSVGRTLSQMKKDRDLMNLLREICALRHQKILDNISLNEDMSNFKRNLSNAEMNSFQAGYNTASRIHKWKAGESGVLTASKIVRPGRKRLKRTLSSMSSSSFDQENMGV